MANYSKMGLSALAAMLALAASPAHADVIATLDVPVAPTATNCDINTDIVAVNAATGTRSSLPAGVNTSAFEEHPSVVGSRLVFRRSSSSTDHIVYMDLATGAAVDLFNVFDEASRDPRTPSITPDGTKVLTGVETASVSGSGNFNPTWLESSLASFPTPPFPFSVRTSEVTVPHPGDTLDPTVRSDGVFAAAVRTGIFPQIHGIVVSRPGVAPELAAPVHGAQNPNANHSMEDPVLSDPATNVVVFQREGNVEGFRLEFGPINGFGSAPTTSLPAPINQDVTLHPAFTPDGRYLGAVQVSLAKHQIRLFVLDTQTQQLLNSNGISLGSYPDECLSRDRWVTGGGLTLTETPGLLSSSLLTFKRPVIVFKLAQASGVGILVQRVVGHHRFLGRRVPTLKPVGRVPFGTFAKGSHRVTWNLRVGGRRLPPGTYRVTPRLLSSAGVVHELGTTRQLRVR